MAPNPCIVIVGAGIAGLSLAIMLERAGMHRYVILERANEYRSLGSAIVLSAMMLRCFEQLGLLEELIAVSKPTTGAVFLDENMKFIGSLPSIFIGQRYGYFNIILTRPDFHRILQRHVPLHKVHFSKKVLEVTQTSERAQIRCSDNTIFHADIVIGADGAYSGIRQSMYRSILAQSRKPNSVRVEKRGLVSTLKKLSFAATSSSPISSISPSSAPTSAPLSSTGVSSLPGLGGASASSAASVASFSTSASVASTATMMTAASSATKHGGGVNRRGEIRLPKSDQEPLRFDQHAMVGITNPLDPDKYPFLKDKSCQAITILPKSGFSVWLFPVTENRICWGLVAQNFVPSNKKGGQGTSRSGAGSSNSNGNIQNQQPNFKVSEWGPETVDEIMQLKSVRDQKSPYGGTMADIYDQTPKGTPLRFMIEDKAFKTWYYMRTVLVGDACHKMVPFAGVGAVNAIMDCIVLANCLYDMPDGDAFTNADITTAFQAYYAQRAEAAIAAVKGSNKVSAMVGSNSPLSLMICKASIASMPEALISLAADRIFASRPILTFLPFVPDYGERKSNPQPLGRRDREELEVLREREKVDQMEAARVKKEARKLRKAKFKPGTSLLRIVGVGGSVGDSGSGNNSKSGGTSRILMASYAASPYMSTPSVATTTLSASLYASRHHHLPRPFQQQQLPRHNCLDGTAPVSVNSQISSSSSSFVDRTSHNRSPSSTERPFSPERRDPSNDYNYDDGDTDSMFSFSSRYTLPYDSDVLSSQYYTGRRGIYPYLDPSGRSPSPSPSQTSLASSTALGHSAAAPLTTEAVASLNRRDSSTSILSTLWKRYGRRNASRHLSSVSIQSSTISGVGFRGFTGGASAAKGTTGTASAGDDYIQQAQNMYDDDDDEALIVGQNHSAAGLDDQNGVDFDVSSPSSQSFSPISPGPLSVTTSHDDIRLSSLSLPSSSSSSFSSSSSPSCSSLSTGRITLPSVAAFVRDGEKEMADEELYNRTTMTNNKEEYEEQMEHSSRAISHYFSDDYRMDFTRKATLKMPSHPPSPATNAVPVASSGFNTSTIIVTFTSTKPLPSLPKTMMTAITSPRLSPTLMTATAIPV